MENIDLPLVEMTLIGKNLAEKGYEMFILSYTLKYVGNKIKKERNSLEDCFNSYYPIGNSLMVL